MAGDQGTVNDTKYYYVVSALDSDKANRASSLLAALPNEKYETLKSFLLSAFQLSEVERVSPLLKLNTVGDSEPS